MNDKYVIEEQVGYLLRRTYFHHLTIFQQSLDETRLTSVQFAVLYAINKLKECSQKELVEETGIDQATIRGIIQRLKASFLFHKILINMTNASVDSYYTIGYSRAFTSDSDCCKY